MELRYKLASFLLSLALRISERAVYDWFWDEVEYLSDDVMEYLTR